MSIKGAKAEKFRQRLLAKRRELLSGVHGANVQEPGEHQRRDPGHCRPSQQRLHEGIPAVHRRHRAAHAQTVDEALHKIRQDTFGLCEACGELIGERRLEALRSPGSASPARKKRSGPRPRSDPVLSGSACRVTRGRRVPAAVRCPIPLGRSRIGCAAAPASLRGWVASVSAATPHTQGSRTPQRGSPSFLASYR